MGKVYTNKPEIPRPNESYIDSSDGRVFVYRTDAHGKKMRVSIGKATGEIMMHPNEMFRYLYPKLWEFHYGTEDTKPWSLHIGLYTLTLGIITQTELYPLLQKAYGPAYTNSLLDYAMFSIASRSDVTQAYPERMKDEVVFADKVHSDEWYSDFFKNSIPEDASHQFRYYWINQCVKMGITHVWLSIDGSNNDCVVMNSDLPEFGESKSHNNKPIVSYMYAVEAGTGRPVTYTVYEGATVDAKAIHRMVLFLAGANMVVDGFILDAGFCTDDVIDTIVKCGYDYVIMMHSNHHGHTEMLKAYGETIWWQAEYSVNDDAVFGKADCVQLFSNHETTGYVNLYFDGMRGSVQARDLIRQIRSEKKRLDQAIAKGKTPVVSASMKDYIDVDQVDGKYVTSYKYENWNKDIRGKGFFSIVSSKNFGPEKVLEIYHLRDASETQYSIMKSQEGFHVTRVHSTPGILSKFAVCFISGIIRCEIELACKNLRLDTNVLIKKMDRIRLVLVGNAFYAYEKSQAKDQFNLLAHFGIYESQFDGFAADVNHRRNDTINSQTHVIPKLPEPQPSLKKKRGRKPGSKNKATIAKEQEMERRIANGENPEEKPKGKPGRKPGSKDSKPRKRRTKKEIELARTMGAQ